MNILLICGSQTLRALLSPNHPVENIKIQFSGAPSLGDLHFFPQELLVILLQEVHKSHCEETLLLSIRRVICFRNCSREYESLLRMSEPHATLFGYWTDLALYPR